jgi:DNA-binding HxlR family transcriptional regulator
MRSYNQYCSVAKALDLVGDRWTLLIVRELLLRGPSRYTDIRDGLPGIATNLLAERLRDLEKAGLVSREDAPPPVATTLFRLTPRGEQLRSAVEELGRWGAPLMFEPSRGDEFRGHWLMLPADLFLTDNAPDEPPIKIQVRAADQEVVLETVEGRVAARAGVDDRPDAVISGPPQVVLGTLTNRLKLGRARQLGLSYKGDPDVLRRIQPETAPAPAATSRDM